MIGERLRLLACPACGHLFAPPREICSHCLAPTLEPRAAGGGGEIVSTTVIRRPPKAFAADGAYTVAVVRLDEGPFVTGRMPGTDERPPGTRVRFDHYAGEAPCFEAGGPPT